MPNQRWIVVLLSTLGLCGLFLIVVPQRVSEASSRNLAVTLTGVPSATITLIPTPIYVVVEALTGNLRAAPRMDGKRIGIVRRGDQFIVMGVAYSGTSLWYLIQLKKNNQGWVSDAIVGIAGDSALIPTIDLTDFYADTLTPTASATVTPTITLTPTKTPFSTVTPTPTNSSG